jgi:hypothetical protein
MPMQIYVLWGTTFLAALLMLALRNIPHRTKATPKTEDDASTPLLGAHKELPAPCSMVSNASCSDFTSPHALLIL